MKPYAKHLMEFLLGVAMMTAGLVLFVIGALLIWNALI